VEVLSLQIFVSLVLVLVSILLFVHAAKSKVHEHADRLAILPLEADRASAARRPTAPKKEDGATGAVEEQR
jgi:hypothetical protein